jgi:hypothetical protein
MACFMVYRNDMIVEAQRKALGTLRGFERPRSKSANVQQLLAIVLAGEW